MTQKYQGPSRTIYFGNIERGKHHCKFLCLVLLIPVGYIVLQCNQHPRVWSIPVKPVLDKSKLVPGKQALEIYQSLRYVHPKNNYLLTHFPFLPNNLTGSQAVCRFATRAPHRRIPIYFFIFFTYKFYWLEYGIHMRMVFNFSINFIVMS